MDINNCIRFDWAAKFILRNKADFIILESFVSTILNEKVTITELIESESNRRAENDKFNRVDIKAKKAKMKSSWWKSSKQPKRISSNGCFMVWQPPLLNTYHSVKIIVR